MIISKQFLGHLICASLFGMVLSPLNLSWFIMIPLCVIFNTTYIILIYE